tara:strand:- start:3439 stop:4236 length:798 start_codon:yes stop_codon:yes gene_type:complete
MKNLFESWRQYVNEEVGQVPFEEIQQIIDNPDNELNKYIRGKVKADKNTISPAGNYYIIGTRDNFDHIKSRHVKGPNSQPGSKFSPNVDFQKAIISLVSKNNPNDTSDPTRIKWLDLPAGIPVGTANVKKASPEEVAKMKKHTSVTEFRNQQYIPGEQKKGAIVTTEEGAKLAQQGEDLLKIPIWTPESNSKAYQIERVAITSGEGKDTQNMSFIAGIIGKVSDGKLLISPITAFPGGDLTDANNKPITDRNKLAAAGYYFVTGK